MWLTRTQLLQGIAASPRPSHTRSAAKGRQQNPKGRSGKRPAPPPCNEPTASAAQSADQTDCSKTRRPSTKRGMVYPKSCSADMLAEQLMRPKTGDLVAGQSQQKTLLLRIPHLAPCSFCFGSDLGPARLIQITTIMPGNMPPKASKHRASKPKGLLDGRPNS